MERKPGGARDVRAVHGAEGLFGGGKRGTRGPGTRRDAEFSALAVRYLDATPGPRHDQFAALVKISAAQISLYRPGTSIPRPDTMDRMAAGVGLPLDWVEAVTADSLLLRGRRTGPPRNESAAELAERLGRRLAAQLAPQIAAMRSEAPEAPPLPPSLEQAAADRTEAARRWVQIEPLTAAERTGIVLEIPAFYSWALVELLCAKSAAAADAPAESIPLARLAVKLSRRVKTTQGFRDQLIGYALLHLAGAMKKESDLPRAREARARGKRLFEAGRAEDPGLLDETVAKGLAAA